MLKQDKQAAIESAQYLIEKYAAGARDFESVNLWQANLESAQLVGINFKQAVLFRANLKNAVLAINTNLWTTSG